MSSSRRAVTTTSTKLSSKKSAVPSTSTTTTTKRTTTATAKNKRPQQEDDELAAQPPVGLPIHGNSSFVIGPRLGCGAQASVHCLLLTNNNNKNKTKKNSEDRSSWSSSSSFSREWVVKLAPLPAVRAAPKKRKSMEELNANSIYHEHVLYSLTSLRDLQGTLLPRLPSPMDTMTSFRLEHHGFTYLVLERMEAPLYDCIRLLQTATATSNLGPLAVRMINIAEAIHQANYIMVDIKSDNFMLAYDEENKNLKSSMVATPQHIANRMRSIDLGFIRSYLDENHKHIPQQDGRTLEGTPLFTSLHMHDGITPSRRDDIFMIGLVLGDLVIRFHTQVQGTATLYEPAAAAATNKKSNASATAGKSIPSYLPWAREHSDQAIGLLKKQNILQRDSELYSRMPPSAADILYQVFMQAHETSFKAVPDYKQFRDLLQYLHVPTTTTKSKSTTSTKKVAAAATTRKGTSRKAATQEPVPDNAFENNEKTTVKRRGTATADKRASDESTLGSKAATTSAKRRGTAARSTQQIGRATRSSKQQQILVDSEENLSGDEDESLRPAKAARVVHLDDDGDEFMSVASDSSSVKLLETEPMDCDDDDDVQSTDDEKISMKVGRGANKNTTKVRTGKQAALGARLTVSISMGASKKNKNIEYEYVMLEEENSAIIVGANPKAGKGSGKNKKGSVTKDFWQIPNDSSLDDNHIQLELVVMRGNVHLSVTDLGSSTGTIHKGAKLIPGKAVRVYPGEPLQLGNQSTTLTVSRWSSEQEPCEDIADAAELESPTSVASPKPTAVAMGRRSTTSKSSSSSLWQEEIETVPPGKAARVCVKEGPHKGEVYEFDISKPMTICIGSDPDSSSKKKSSPNTVIRLEDDENLAKNHATLELDTLRGYLKIAVTDLKHHKSATLVAGKVVPKGKSVSVSRGQPIAMGDTILEVLCK